MNIQTVNEKLQMLSLIEAEATLAIAAYLHENFNKKERFCVFYSESVADDSWTVGLTEKGLFFDNYAYDLYESISKSINVTPVSQENLHFYVQDIRYFNAIPLHVLKHLYQKYITLN